MSDRDNGGMPVQVVCRKTGTVINPQMITFGGADVDVEWLNKCDCEGTCEREKYDAWKNEKLKSL